MRVTVALSVVIVSLCPGSIGCGSSSSSPEKRPGMDSGMTPDGSKPKDAAADVIVDPKNCVPPGTASNSDGVGGYCSPAGGQCDMVGPEGVAEICTADLDGTPAHDWYCTMPCSKTSQCGAGATCASTAMGSRCVPKSCDAFVPEGGLDSGADVLGDAPGDVVDDAPRDASVDH
jgi:hypothetical protein